MAKAKKKPKAQSSTIALNKKAKHDYHLTDKTEAGLVLAGWEVKSLRDGRVTLTDTYVIFQRQEAWLVGAHITPLNTASTHVVAEPMRSRKLLLNRREIDKMMGLSEQKGYTVVATALYWKANHVKCEVALAKGKKEFDKRADQKEKDWNKQKERIMKHSY